jgi:hypothetical protein
MPLTDLESFLTQVLVGAGVFLTVAFVLLLKLYLVVGLVVGVPMMMLIERHLRPADFERR